MWPGRTEDNIKGSATERVYADPSNHSHGLSPSSQGYCAKGWDRTEDGFPREENRAFPKCTAAISHLYKQNGENRISGPPGSEVPEASGFSVERNPSMTLLQVSNKKIVRMDKLPRKCKLNPNLRDRHQIPVRIWSN